MNTLTREKKTKKQYQKLADEYLETKVICKCGRRMPIPAWKSECRCGWCGGTVKNTSRARFKYVMLREMGDNKDE
jgi:hypothetical protein